MLVYFLFTVYISGSGVGCWFGKFYVGVLACANDIVLLAASASVIWNLSNSNVEKVCSTWRAGLRRVWGCLRLLIIFFCLQSHADLHYLMRLLKGLSAIFKLRCLSSDFKVVKFVTSYGIRVGRMFSPIGSSAQFCSTKFGFTLPVTCCVAADLFAKLFS